jgi:hypothetical protein
MKAVTSLRLVCGKCGGKDIERTLVYTEVELQGSCAGLRERGTMSVEKEWGAKWSAELERRGVASVVAMLSGSEVGIGRGSDFRLFIQGMPNPSRGFVEDWIGRKEAEERLLEADKRQLEAKRFRYLLWPTLVAALAAAIAAWPVVRDWIK